jgi:DNA-binding NarL/FixJ family response regulator
MQTNRRTSPPPTILIVEDQEVMRRAMRELVAGAFPECTILEAGDGTAARRLCHEREPQLAILDVLLPDNNGIILSATLRTMRLRPVVIVTSSLSDPIYRELALASGASDYIVEDDLPAELVPAVAKALAGLR